MTSQTLSFVICSISRCLRIHVRFEVIDLLSRMKYAGHVSNEMIWRAGTVAYREK